MSAAGVIQQRPDPPPAICTCCGRRLVPVLLMPGEQEANKSTGCVWCDPSTPQGAAVMRAWARYAVGHA